METTMERFERNTPVVDLVLSSPEAARVLFTFDIGLPADRERTVGQACEREGLDVAWLAAQVEAAEQVPDLDPASLAPEALIDHVLEHYHAPAHVDLDRLATVLEGLTDGPDLSASAVRAVFGELAKELSSHLRKEELMVFPRVRGALRAGDPESVAMACAPLDALGADHVALGDLLRRLDHLTGGFRCAADARVEARVLVAGLADFAATLAVHSDLEDRVLLAHLRPA